MNNDGSRTAAATAASIAVAVLFFAAAAAVYWYFVLTAAGQQLDASAFGAIGVLRDPLHSWAGRLRVVLLVVCGALAVALIVLALVRRRWRDSIVAVAICLITILVSLVLKQVVLTRPALGDFGYPYNTFPSDHAAITTASLIASYLVLPASLRRGVAIVALLVLGSLSGLIQVVSLAHRPSDVFAGALLAGGVAALFLRGWGGVSRAWRAAWWGLAVLAAVAAVACFIGWSDAGYAGSARTVGTLAVLFGAAAAVAASLAVAAELRPHSARSTEPA
jgi:membrane-associated phospholipid phosphatase